MAYVKIGAINRYLGVSADTKPASDIPGSTFLELDTKNLYVYDGDSWELGNPTFQTGDVINVGDLEGKDTEGAAVTGRPVTIGYKSATGKATGVTPVNALPVQVSGSIESVTAAPLTGVKTVTATAAEVFAGGSAKANRRMLAIRNDDPVLRCRIGKSDVTQQTGFPIEPGATVHIQFDPATAVAVYAISEGAALSISVLEV